MTTALPATGTTTTWAFDPSHTDVQFAVRHMIMSTVRGHFPGITGTIVLDEANTANSSVEVEIEAATITTRDESRDAHLRSTNFLNTETYPTITFTSTKVAPKGSDDLAITGDLTIAGVTREVVLDTTFNGRGKSPFGAEILSYSAETAIDRRDFGLTWNVAIETGGFMVGDDLKINIELEAVLQES